MELLFIFGLFSLICSLNTILILSELRLQQQAKNIKDHFRQIFFYAAPLLNFNKHSSVFGEKNNS
jgi:hypothetical protein